MSFSEESLARELEYHEKLYSGFAQRHFARPAVRALRRHMVRRILAATGAGETSRVLSLGCGIGDTELLLAPRVKELVGVDLSPAAIRQARADASQSGRGNLRFEVGTLDDQHFAPGSFDVAVAVFLLHHLPDGVLAASLHQVHELLAPGGVFYAIDPSRHRLSGTVGRRLVPKLMARYQTPGERELDRWQLAALLEGAHLEAEVGFYDFLSTPLAGLLPGWRAGYALSRLLDNVLVHVPLLRRLGSNLEVIARKVP
jgi:SAM-dependent methyltransferase